MTERQKVIRQNDDLFREIIRLRDKVCQRTLRKRNLQVAHFFTRGNLRTRWDERNACLLSAGKHRYWAHKEHEQFRDWWIKRIGQDEFDLLKMRAEYVGGTIPTTDLKIWTIALKRQLEDLKNA